VDSALVPVLTTALTSRSHPSGDAEVKSGRDVTDNGEVRRSFEWAVTSRGSWSLVAGLSVVSVLTDVDGSPSVAGVSALAGVTLAVRALLRAR
jgi:hypothetical protein